MDLKEFGAKLVNLAPALGGAFLGPLGAAGGTLFSAIAKSFGLGDDAKPDEVFQAIQADPESAIKLKALEYEHNDKVLMLNQQRELEEIRAELADRKSAREREIKITQATGEKETNLYVLAWVTVFGFFGCVALTILVTLPTTEMAKTLLAMLFGALVAGFKDVLNYFFGSSRSSQGKTKLLVNGMVNGMK